MTTALFLIGVPVVAIVAWVAFEVGTAAAAYGNGEREREMADLFECGKRQGFREACELREERGRLWRVLRDEARREAAEN